MLSCGERGCVVVVVVVVQWRVSLPPLSPSSLPYLIPVEHLRFVVLSRHLLHVDAAMGLELLVHRGPLDRLGLPDLLRQFLLLDVERRPDDAKAV